MKKKQIIFALTLCLLLCYGCGASKEAVNNEQVNTAVEALTDEHADADTAKTADPAEIYETEDHEMTTVIDGCDTFTQILDKEENKGMGYTNVHIGDEDVLLMASETFQYDTDFSAAIDAEIFYYNDGQPAYMGYVAAGGTAYPLCVKDGVLYVGGNHFLTKYTIQNNELIIIEEVYVVYDTDGASSYYYRTEGEDYSDHTPEEAEQKFNDLFGEMDENSILHFDTIK